MHQRINKKILFYIFLFLLIGTHNNKNFNNLNFFLLNEINVSGLEKDNNTILMKKLDLIRPSNLLLINKKKLTEIISSNNLVEKFTIFKQYPSTLNIDIIKTQFLANVKKDNTNFLLGSNGKLIQSIELRKNVPLIIGNFKNQNFFELKDVIDKVNFDYFKIKNLFFFKSGRWDIETYSGLLIKLPKKNLSKSLKLAINILDKDLQNNITKIDLRQSNQVIIYGK